MQEDLLKIINYYGFNGQLKKLNEECYELIEAIKDYEYQKEACMNNHCTELHVEKCKEHMEEEFADVMVVLEQFKTFYQLDNDKIVDIMYSKIDRQLERIEREVNNGKQ